RSSLHAAKHDHGVPLDSHGIAGADLTRIAEIGHRIVGIDRPHPHFTPGTLRQFEVDPFPMRVEKDVEAVIHHGLAMGVRSRNSFSIQEEAEATGETGLPIFFRHLPAIGFEPADVADVCAAQGTTEEPATTLEDDMLAAEMNDRHD